MKKLLLIALYTTTLISSNINISKNRQNILDSQKKSIISSSDKLEKSWINPLIIGGNLQKTKSIFDIKSKNKELFISMNQDVFRSGGIFYAISYAKANKSNALLLLDKETSDLKYQIVLELLNKKELEYELKSSKFKLRNLEIEVFLKKDLYNSGSIDITLFNNAIIANNKQKRISLQLENEILKSKLRLSYLSGYEYEIFDLVSFKQISKDDFIKKNYNINLANSNSNILKYEEKLAKSSFLPKLNINAKLSKQTNNLVSNFKNIYSYGVSISMPLSFNTLNILDEARYQKLTQQLRTIDIKNEQKVVYEKDELSLSLLDKQSNLSQENIQLYKELISYTKAEVKAGTKTKYDLETLKNTKETFLLDIKINDIKKQKILSKLYYSIKL